MKEIATFVRWKKLNTQYMKPWIFSLLLILFLPCVLKAQTAETTLHKVSAAISDGQNSQAIGLFRQAIQADADKSEMFYWTSVDKNSAVCLPLAQELATYYKTSRNYDKAYLFYKELLQREPDKIEYLLAYADTEVCRGKEKEALRTYEQVLRADPNNLSANIFIGNYYYLQAEQQKSELDTNFKKISSPSKMQVARYRDGLADIFSTGYGKAREYLQNVVRQFPSTEAVKTLNKIKLIEKELSR